MSGRGIEAAGSIQTPPPANLMHQGPDPGLGVIRNGIQLSAGKKSPSPKRNMVPMAMLNTPTTTPVER